MPLSIKGRGPSSDARRELADAGAPVLLAFSRGKDSIAAWIALRDAGVEVVPFHWEGVPGLSFVRDDLAYWQEFFGTRIHRYPHPSFWRQLRAYVFQPPERYEVIEAARLPAWTFRRYEDAIRANLGLPPETFVADGVRVADTLARRVAITKHGYIRPSTRKASVIADWRKGEVLATIRRAGARLPVDYSWWGRSFDGIAYEYVAALAQHAPDDYEVVRSWFPLIDLELLRHEITGALPSEAHT